MLRIVSLFFCIALFWTVGANTKVVNPLNYGLLKTNSPIENFYILQRCHTDALKNGCSISYTGVDTLYIEIPKDAEPLPLTKDVDFANATIIVDNKQKDCFLFRMTSQMTPIDIKGSQVDQKNYRCHPVLNKGTFLLVVEDNEPWCARDGYDSKVKRRDVMLIKNGRASNSPVMSYCTSVSKPVAKYRRIDSQKTLVRNLNFVRTASSTFETYCLSIAYQNNVELNRINVTTPQGSQLFADKVIYLESCVDVTLNDIRIDGTYSQKRKYGYGICLMNISNLKVNRMYGRGNWGVFGTHCLNNVTLKDCDINRFDIHCYGKDVKAIGCKFVQLYNQFSSVYGTISFIRCEFDHCRPVLIESSYNAYTPFNLVWKNCTFYLDKSHNYLMTLFGVPESYNERPELRKKSLPNIYLKNCKVVLDDEISTWYIVQTGGVKYKDSFDGISEITIKGLTVENEGDKEFQLFSEEVKTSLPVKTVVKMRH